MDNKFNLLVPTTLFVPQPYGGVRSATDLNTFMDTVKNDIYKLYHEFNSRIIPILNGLPLAEYENTLDAIIGGLTSAYMFVASNITGSSTYADYYYHATAPTRPNTVKEVFDLLIHEVEDLKDTVNTLSTELNQSEPEADLNAILSELNDIRNSITEIINVLRALKFYTDWERIHGLTVLADPDPRYAPTQVLLNYGPAVKFDAAVDNNLYINFTVPRNIDPAQNIICNIVYCMDVTEAASNLKIDMSYHVLAPGDNVMTATAVDRTITLVPPTDAHDIAAYTSTDLYIKANSVNDLINIKLSRDTSVASNHSGNFYISDLSFYGKRLEAQQIFI